MSLRIGIICLGVEDLERSLRFYRDGLGLPTTRSERVIFFQTEGVCLALYPYDKLADDVSETFRGPRSKFAGFTLTHSVRTREEVDEVLRQAQAAGGRIEKPAQDTNWDGYAGYFSDPDGYLWEVAWGVFEMREDGSLVVT